MSKSLKRNAFDFVTRMLVKAITVLRKKERNITLRWDLTFKKRLKVAR